MLIKKDNDLENVFLFSLGLISWSIPLTLYPMSHGFNIINKGWVCQIVTLPISITKYLNAKEEELWKLEYFTIAKYNPSKKQIL
jgi:hypothetical protein